VADVERDRKEAARDAWNAAVKRRLQAALDHKGLSHRALAKKLGVSGGAVSLRLTSGALNEWWMLYRIAEELGISADAILGFKPVPFDEDAPGQRARERAERRLERAEQMIRTARKDLDERILKRCRGLRVFVRVMEVGGGW